MRATGSWRRIATTCALLLSGCEVDDRILSVAPDGGAASEGLDGAVDAMPSPDVRVEKPDVADEPPLDGGGGKETPSDAVAPPSVDAPAPPSLDAGPCVHVSPIGQPDCDQTLVANADFNRDIHGWAPDVPTVVEWRAADAQNAARSGSIAVKDTNHIDLDGWGAGGAAQCVAAKPGTTYDFAAEAFIKRGQSTGFAQIAVWFYREAGCAGLLDQAYSVAVTDTTNAWTHINGSLITPTTSQSMAVRLVSQKPFREEPLEVLFDAVRVRAR